MKEVWESCYKSGSEGVANIDCIPGLITNLLYWAFVLAGIIAIIMIIFAGIKYIRSGGDSKQTQSARQTLTFAIIGLILIFGSVMIINIVARVTGVGCLRYYGVGTCDSGRGISNVNRTGEYGCFVISKKRSCHVYSPNNNPKRPIQWYNNEDTCEKYCVNPKDAPTQTPGYTVPTPTGSKN